ncbi:hypothetical protein ACFQ51_55920 [Streptomyces kaempferi]
MVENEKELILLLERRFGADRPIPLISHNPMFDMSAESDKYKWLGEALSGADRAILAAKELANISHQDRPIQLQSWASTFEWDKTPFLGHPLFLETLKQAVSDELDVPNLLELEQGVHRAALASLRGREKELYATRIPEMVVNGLVGAGISSPPLLGVFWVYYLVRVDSMARSLVLTQNEKARVSIFGSPIILDLLMRRLPRGEGTELDDVFSAFMRNMHTTGRWRDYIGQMPSSVREVFSRVSGEGGLLWPGNHKQNPYGEIISWFNAVGVARELAAANRVRREALLVNMKELPSELKLLKSETADLFAALPKPESFRLMEALKDAANADRARDMDRRQLLSMFLNMENPRINSFFDVDGIARRRLKRQHSSTQYATFETESRAAYSGWQNYPPVLRKFVDLALDLYKRMPERAERFIIDVLLEQSDLPLDDLVARGAYKFQRWADVARNSEAPPTIGEFAYDSLAALYGHRPEDGVFDLSPVVRRVEDFTGEAVPLREILTRQMVRSVDTMAELLSYFAEKGGALAPRWALKGNGNRIVGCAGLRAMQSRVKLTLVCMQRFARAPR